MMVRKKFYLWSAICVIMLTGCAQNPFDENSGSQKSNAHSAELLNLTSKSATCPLICWHGIQPNETQKSEVLEILELNYGIETIEVWDGAGQTVVEPMAESGLVLIFVNYDNQSPDPDNPDVRSIGLFFRAANFSIGELIAMVGEPNEVHLGGLVDPQNKSCANALLIFEELGMEAGLMSLTENEDFFAGVDPSQAVGSISIWNPNTLTIDLPPYYGAILDWDGYMDYCAEAWK